jgi:hypothetical protein
MHQTGGTMKIKIEIEVTDAEQKALLQNSIERVLNNAIDVGSAVEQKGARVSQDIRDRASTLWQDCEELKPIVSKVWWAAANEVRVEAYKAEAKAKEKLP